VTAVGASRFEHALNRMANRPEAGWRLMDDRLTVDRRLIDD
jgi:hypothetical protein